MFLSETLVRVIHADRVRDLERAARNHRLLTADDDTSARQSAASVRIAPATKRPACSDSAGQPA